MTTVDNVHHSLRKWLNGNTQSRAPRDAHELVVLPSGETDFVWRADVEQVNALHVDELTTAVQDAAGGFANTKGASVRFFIRWITSDTRILVGTTFRMGDGALMPMDGSPESIVIQMQKTMETALRASAEQMNEAVNALKWMTKESHEETATLRGELRFMLDKVMNPGSVSDTSGTGAAPSPTEVKYNSHAERVVSNLLEKAGNKYVEKMFEADAGASGKSNVVSIVKKTTPDAPPDTPPAS